MRMIEVVGGYKIALSSEESTLVEEIRTRGNVTKKELTERQAEVARRLVGKGVLSRQKSDKGIYFSFRGLSNLDI